MIDFLNRRISRRTFLKASAVAGGAIATSQTLFMRMAGAATYGENNPDPISGATVKYYRTMCMGCNAACGQTVQVVNGIASKCSGNPYHPATNDYAAAGPETVPSDISEAQRYEGARACAKGQAMIMTLYSPYRLTRVLKRTGARGAGQWQVISWAEAVNSISHGYTSTGTEATLPRAYGVSPYTIRGEGASLAQIRQPGHTGIPSSFNPVGFSSMASGDIHPAVGDPMDAGSARDTYRASVGGRAANQLLVFPGGRNQWENGGRFAGNFGTRSQSDHRSLCNSAYMDGTYDSVQGYGWKPTLQAGSAGPDYVILFGVNYHEAAVPHVPIARWLADFTRRTGTTLVTTDVRVSQTAAKADVRLVPAAGKDTAVALGIIKRWLDGGITKYAEDYLRCPTGAQLGTGSSQDRPAGARMVPDATHLVWTTGADVGKKVLPTAVSLAGVPTAATGLAATDRAVLAPGPLTGGILGVESAMTAFELFKNYVDTKTVAQWEAEAGVPAGSLLSIADACDFSTPRKLAVDHYRGAVAHTNGIYASRATGALNTLQDRHNRIDGVASDPGFSAPGGFGGGGGFSTAATPAGVPLDRNGSMYGAGAPSINNPLGLGAASGGGQPRQWYPCSNRQIQQEALPSAAEGYPYKIKALWMHGSNHTYSVSFGFGAPGTAREHMKAHDNAGVYKIPLIVDITTNMDETAAHADFVLPEGTYLERWAHRKNGYAGVNTRHMGIRRPVVGGYADVTIDGAPGTRMYLSPFASSTYAGATEEDWLSAFQGPMVMEDIHIRFGKKLGLVGFGANGGGAQGNYHSAYQFYNARLTTADYALAGLGGDGAGGTLSSLAAPSTFGGDGAGASAPLSGDANRFLYMGGKFANPAAVGAGGWVTAGTISGSANLWAREWRGNNLRVMIGKASGFGAADFEDIKKVCLPTNKATGTDMNPLSATAIGDDGFDKQWVTYKSAWHAQTRTTENKWLLPLTGRDREMPGVEPRDPSGLPTVWINPTDAADVYGLVNGGRVRVTSATNSIGVIGKAQFTHAVSAGSVVCDHHYGRRWFGSGNPDHRYAPGTDSRTHTSVVGTSAPDSRIAAGAAHSPSVRSTQRNGINYNIGMTEPISGQMAYQSGRVKLTAVV